MSSATPAAALKILHVLRAPVGGLFRHVLDVADGQIARGHHVGIVADSLTGGTFAAMSLYGYTTKRDLSGFGSFLFMGLIGLILASVVNIFLGSTALQFAISVIGVLVFTGLTAYDTQRIKEMYAEYDAADVGVKKAILGAFMLYLDFINLFVYMLQFLGVARSE